MSASLVAQRRSYSLLSRRGWPCHANVLATTHRRGSTRNPGGGSYLDQSIWSGGRSLGTPTFLSRGGGETICALPPRVGSLPSLPFPVPLEAASHPTRRRPGTGGRPPPERAGKPSREPGGEGPPGLPRPALSPVGLLRPPRRPCPRENPPGPARAELIEDGIADDAQRVETGTADRRLGRQERLEQRPVAIREVAGREQMRGVHAPA